MNSPAFEQIRRRSSAVSGGTPSVPQSVVATPASIQHSQHQIIPPSVIKQQVKEEFVSPLDVQTRQALEREFCMYPGSSNAVGVSFSEGFNLLEPRLRFDDLVARQDSVSFPSVPILQDAIDIFGTGSNPSPNAAQSLILESQKFQIVLDAPGEVSTSQDASSTCLSDELNNAHKLIPDISYTLAVLSVVGRPVVIRFVWNSNSCILVIRLSSQTEYDQRRTSNRMHMMSVEQACGVSSNFMSAVQSKTRQRSFGVTDLLRIASCAV